MNTPGTTNDTRDATALDAETQANNETPDTPSTDYSDLLAFYRKHVNEHQTGHRATGWGTRVIQMHSFDLVTRLDGFGNGVSVLDVGCGIGDLLDFLHTKNITVDYVGVDVCPEMIQQASARHPKATFLLHDISQRPLERRFDYVICSGTLNLRLPNHEQWLENMIHSMYEHCDRGMAFNLLSQHYAEDHEDFQHAGEFYFADPALIFTFCQTLTRRVSINHSDNIESFNVSLYREESTACERLVATLAPFDHYDETAHNVFSFACELKAYTWAHAFLKSFEANPKTQHAYAQLYFALNDMEQLSRLCENALRQDPDDSYFHFCLGMCFQRQNAKTKALKHLERALALEPDNDQYLSHAICQLMACNKRSRALALLPKLPSAAQRAFLEGVLWHRAEAYQTARQCYELALRLSPSYTLAQNCLAVLSESHPDPAHTAQPNDNPASSTDSDDAEPYDDQDDSRGDMT